MAVKGIKPACSPEPCFRNRNIQLVVKMGRTIFFFDFRVNLHTTENGVHIMTIYVNSVPFEFQIAMDRTC